MNQERLMALVRLIVPLVVTIASMVGYSLDADVVFNVVSTIASVALFVWAWWKNNNMTEAAQEAQVLLNQLKEIKRLEKDASQ